ncbi:sigma 54-interacting transcriptional regulator [Metapseudomonas otitidis]|uniref:sigma 54-interacting transcriptional regulator n=1 Tax=Metapseudomonas otitidis TaxID=319939 RepID=UPI0013F670B3|nr:sigma-54 factor interaction domain-containing protein [Pseudomonas otitidis]
MSQPANGQPLLTFADADRSPLSIRARALVFVDARSRRLREEIEHLAPAAVPALIQGETGTGKELLARQIHRASERPGLFVAVNCGAISKAYAEAELFGHAPDAHAGSASSRAGWFGSANGGTLYLDEIGDLPLPLQARLLAALESREVTRLGAQQPTPVDVRLVAATSIDLAQAVLESYPWPGNTRELENSIHFALLVSDGEEILPHHLNLPPAPSYAQLAQQLRQLAANDVDKLRQLFAEVLAG